MSNSRVSEELAQLQSKYRQLDNKHSAESLNSSSSITFLEGRVKELEAEVKESSNWKRRATALSIDLAEERRRTQEGMQRGQDDREDQQVDQVVRMELTREFTLGGLASDVTIRPIDVSVWPKANLCGFADRGAGSEEEDEGSGW